MEKVKRAADMASPPIKFDYKLSPATLIPLDPYLIPRAASNQLADTIKDANGNWFREVIPITVTYGDLTNLGFDYIGFIRYADFYDTATKSTKSEFFPTIVQELGTSDEEHEKKVAKLSPQLESMAAKFTDYKSIGCDHCNPKGDNIERHEVYVVQSTKDQVRQGGRKGSQGFKMNLKKGDILQIGTGCMGTYTGIDVNALAAFYELDREIGAYGRNASPNNPAGWGWKEMGIYDYADRLVQYFGKREQEWLSSHRKSIWEVEMAEQLYGNGTISNLIDRKSKDGEGCFIRSKGGMLLKSRMFNLNAGTTAEPQWMMQPETGAGSVQEMIDLWETGVATAKQMQTVMVINEADGTPIIDPATGDIMEEEVEVPSTAYIRSKLVRSRYGQKRGEWELKIVPILPPALDSKYVENTRNRMLAWINGADPQKIEGGKFADLVRRLKSTVKIGYVGPKTFQEAPELWRMFSFADFDRRKRADKKQQIKAFKLNSEANLQSNGLNTSNMKWFKIKEQDPTDMRQYAQVIYPSSYSYSSSDNFRYAFSQKFMIVMMTPAEYSAYPQWLADKKAKEAIEQKKREADRKYRQEVNRIEQEGYANRYTDGRPYNRSVPYNPVVGEFLALLGWRLNDPTRFKDTNLFRVDGSGSVTQAKLTDKQLDAVRDKFRPQIMVQGQVIPSSSTPAPATATSTVTDKRDKIAMAAAKRMGIDARGKSTHQSSKGGVIPKVAGYCTFVSRPFYRRGMAGSGHTITIVNPDTQNAFVVFYYGQDLPVVGKYYNMFDVEVDSHTSYQGLNQTIVEDSQGGQIKFVDATN